MKKLRQIVMALAVMIVPLTVGSVARAESTCQNGYTGPDSNNVCTSTQTYACTVDNNNKVTVTNDGTQISVSGTASNTGNNTGGDAQSGSATNSNGVTFNATVKNGNVCTVTATVPATPSTPTTPATPSSPQVGGLGATRAPVATAVAAPKAAPPVLANTSGDQAPLLIGGSIVAIGALTALSRFGSYVLTRRSGL